jgi:hypothetical protein
VSGVPTRRELLIAGAGAVASATLIDAATATAAKPQRTAVPPAQAQFEARRIERLLRVELLLLFCYQHVLESSILPPGERRALEPLRVHEEAHIQALTRALRALAGEVPAPPANVTAADIDLAHREVRGRLGELQGKRDALRLLLAVERVAVGAYFVALIKLDDPHLITLVSQIMAADAQHEAVIGELLYHGDAEKAVPYAIVQGVQ